LLKTLKFLTTLPLPGWMSLKRVSFPSLFPALKTGFRLLPDNPQTRANTGVAH
jgi:hypothetical protein